MTEILVGLHEIKPYILIACPKHILQFDEK